MKWKKATNEKLPTHPIVTSVTYDDGSITRIEIFSALTGDPLMAITGYIFLLLPDIIEEEK